MEPCKYQTLSWLLWNEITRLTRIYISSCINITFLSLIFDPELEVTPELVF